MMRKLLLAALGTALAVLVVAAAVWWLTPPRPGITEANCARIKPGMRQEEVEAILGEPPCEYGKLIGCRLGPDGADVPPPPGSPSVGMWVGGQGEVSVKFDGDGAAIIARFNSRGEPTFWDRLRSLLP